MYMNRTNKTVKFVCDVCICSSCENGDPTCCIDQPLIICPEILGADKLQTCPDFKQKTTSTEEKE